MLCKVTHCTVHNLANTRPHQLRWCDKERNLEFGKELKNKYILELAQNVMWSTYDIQMMVWNALRCKHGGVVTQKRGRENNVVKEKFIWNLGI